MKYADFSDASLVQKDAHPVKMQDSLILESLFLLAVGMTLAGTAVIGEVLSEVVVLEVAWRLAAAVLPVLSCEMDFVCNFDICLMRYRCYCLPKKIPVALPILLKSHTSMSVCLISCKLQRPAFK